MSTPCATVSTNTPCTAEESCFVETPVEVLREIVRRYGTPSYAYDLKRLRVQVSRLRKHLPAEVEVLYSLKANASLGLCGVLAECGLGADVASAGELAIAVTAGFAHSRIFVTGPDRSTAAMAALRSAPETVISVDSPSELRRLADSNLNELGMREQPRRVLLRLRPDFCSFATCSAGPDSRFGFLMDDLSSCRDFLASHKLHRVARVVGFHIFSGSQILSAEGMIHHLRSGVAQALRAAEILELTPEIIDLGGGFGIPYALQDRELDLELIGAEMRSLVKQAAPAQLVLELGRYLVAQAGWYLTTVLTQQKYRSATAVVVDGGTHQRGDLCGLGLRHKGFSPTVLTRADAETLIPTDVLGCLSLPGDVLAEGRPLPPLSAGDVLAFPNAGAYGLAASPWLFHGHPAPTEVAFDGTSMQLLRLRQPPESVLEGQFLISKQMSSE